MIRSIFKLLVKASWVLGVAFLLLWIVGQWRVMQIKLGSRTDHQQMIAYASVGFGQNSFCFSGLLEKFSDVKIAVEDTDRHWGSFSESFVHIAPTSDPGELAWMIRPVFTRRGLDGLLEKLDYQTANYWARGWFGWSITPYWSMIASCAVLPLVNFLRRLKLRQRQAAGLCAQCGYDLRASSGRCPECGTPIPVKPEPVPI